MLWCENISIMPFNKKEIKLKAANVIYGDGGTIVMKPGDNLILMNDICPDSTNATFYQHRLSFEEILDWFTELYITRGQDFEPGTYWNDDDTYCLIGVGLEKD